VLRNVLVHTLSFPWAEERAATTRQVRKIPP
jgi:hypothetical protein